MVTRTRWISIIKALWPRPEASINRIGTFNLDTLGASWLWVIVEGAEGIPVNSQKNEENHRNLHDFGITISAFHSRCLKQIQNVTLVFMQKNVGVGCSSFGNI